jgi:hypothetical protein
MPSPADEWERLQRRYRKMSDDELLELTDESSGLTDMAREVLYAEVSVRGITREHREFTLPEEDRYVVVQRTSRLISALETREALHSLGIEATVEGEDERPLRAFIDTQVGGISVCVHQKDLAKAEQAFRDWEAARYEAQREIEDEH